MEVNGDRKSKILILLTLSLTSLKNPELWDEVGDTFVYVYIRGSKTKPPPSFRLQSGVMEAQCSNALLDKLHHTKEPAGWPKFIPYSRTQRGQNARPLSPENTFDSHGTAFHGAESDDSDVIRPLGVTEKTTSKTPPGIEHELYFEWPGSETGVHSTLWHVTTRNFFAIMYNASSLVGTTLYDCLKMLLERMLMYSNYLDDNTNVIGWINDYLVRYKYDDVRNNPSYAASLLAFSELPQVRWREGYIEGFVHCAGMLRMGLDTVTEWRHISPVTKMYLNNANLELEERVHRAQVWLHDFDFSEMWPASSAPPSAARGCYDRLRKWICKYYENAFLHWPTSNEETWLLRDTVLRLRDDFHGLYDYLIDRDVAFDNSNVRPGRKVQIISTTQRHFSADTADLPVTEMLLAFDARNNFPHIPHPYPRVPPSFPVSYSNLKAVGKGGFHIKKSNNASENPAEARRKALSYAEASNVYVLRDQYVHTDLVSNFIRFEQSDMVDQVDPHEARLGRWILIYGILQVLATISVDHPNLRYNDGAQYHLSPQMKGVLPWSSANTPPEEEADHTHSHCWVAPLIWRDSTAPAPLPKEQHQQTRAVPRRQASTQHRPIIWGQYGDGRTRGDSNSNASNELTSPVSDRGVPNTIREASPAAHTKQHRLKTSRSASAMNAMSSPETPSKNPTGGKSSSSNRKRMEEWVASTKGGPPVATTSTSSISGDSSSTIVAGHPRASSSLAGSYSQAFGDFGNSASSPAGSRNAGAHHPNNVKPNNNKFGTFTTIQTGSSPKSQSHGNNNNNSKNNNNPPTAASLNTTTQNIHGTPNGLPPPRSGSRLGGGIGGGIGGANNTRKQSPTHTNVSAASSDGWASVGGESASREITLTRELASTRRMSPVSPMGGEFEGGSGGKGYFSSKRGQDTGPGGGGSARVGGGEKGRENYRLGVGAGMGGVGAQRESGYQPPADW